MANTNVIFDIDGISNVIANLERTFRVFGTQAHAALLDDAMSLKEESQMEVPVITGALQASAYVEEVDNGGNTVAFEVGYGGANVQVGARGYTTDNYAVVVHENLSAQHPNGGKAKYLEDPVNRYASQAEQSLARKLQIL